MRIKRTIAGVILALSAAGSILAASGVPAVAVNAAPASHAVAHGTYHFE